MFTVAVRLFTKSKDVTVLFNHKDLTDTLVCFFYWVSQEVYLTIQHILLCPMVIIVYNV